MSANWKRSVDHLVGRLAAAVASSTAANAETPDPPAPQTPDGEARRPVGHAPSRLALPDKPSIAVLPFANMSGDPEQGYFVDGMVEEIITALSRIRWLFVIALSGISAYETDLLS